VAELHTDIVADPIDVAAAIDAASSTKFGGIAVFIGTVRESASVDRGAIVTRLEYDAHPELAQQRLREIAERAAEKWDVGKVVAIHRTGACDLGEPTVVVACGAPHRGDALEACRWVIDTLKAEVPIWKREVYADERGSAWVNTP
jgi:molybdopterin synthase catalytic subunit